MNKMIKIGIYTYIEFENYQKNIYITKIYVFWRFWNLDESSTNKNPNHGCCSYGHKLVCVDDEFIKTFNLYLGEDAIYILLKVCYKKVSILVM